MNEKITILQDEIRDALKYIEQNKAFYDDFLNNDLPQIGKKRLTAIALSQIMVEFYTCAETIFFRISQFFENNLSRESWHKDLLNRMKLDITGIRPSVIREETYHCMKELLGFRHFFRYYYEGNYDWERLEFLSKKYEAAHSLVLEDLNALIQHLDNIKQ